MEYDTSTLIVLAEVTIAFVAFAIIVASLRVTFGEKLSPFEVLLVHFFTESGMLTVSFTLLTLVLLQFWSDPLLVATLVTWYAFLMIIVYLISYLRRRLRIEAPTPFLSLINIVIWMLWACVLGITLTGYYWAPSLAIISSLVFWGLFSAALIFMSFLTNFLDNKT